MALAAMGISTLGTVYHYFQAWQDRGVWVHLHRVLYEQARRDAGREACPSLPLAKSRCNTVR
jgi:transposase